ncbi:MAG: response regulator [Desulfobacteraceae bacterium]|nr:MAG: response regulator [Desulfobacteraceae bacterium]
MTGQSTADQSFSQESTRKYSPIEKLAFISLPLFLLLSVFILMLSPATIFEPPLLLPILNMIFLTIVPLFAVIAMLQDFVRNGPGRNLFFACALLIFGLTSMVAGFAISLPTSPNPTVTIHNIGAFLTALLLCAAPSVQDLPGQWKTYARRKGVATLAVLTIVSLTCVLSVLSVMDVLPPFFVRGKGPTTLRVTVLFAAVGLMFWASALAYRAFRKERSFFFYWKSIGLAIIGTGLLVVLFQRGVGSPEGWLGRTAQYIGCLYLLYSTHVSFYEQSLLDSEKRYHLLAESTSDVVWQLDLLTNRYTYISPSIYRLRGYTPEEAMSQPLEFGLTSASLQDVQGLIRQATEEFAQGRTDTITPVREVEQTCKDGSTVWTEVSTTFVLDSDHRPIAINGISRSITERKLADEDRRRLERELQQLQKTESLTRMAGAIAHHFNNQLGVVIGNLELAMMNKLSGSSGQDKTLAEAMKSAIKAAEMSGFMLTYLGQTHDKQVTFDLSGTCNSSLSMLRAAIPKDVVLKTDLPSPGPTVRANEKQIQQVLTNLVTNAWEAMGDGRGAINLTVKTVSPADIPASHRFPVEWKPQENDYACLEVADTGCGIADNDIEKLFDPFYSSKFTGRGLGLPVILGILRAHLGAVTVESEPGKGSLFRVFLPVSAEEVSRQPEKAAEAPKMEGGGTVLLVEDEQALLKMAGIMITNMGYTVLQAKDGVEAVEMFQQHKDKIQCVLCDLTMPRMDGWGTLAALRKLSPGIPVVLASGYNENQVMAGDHLELPQAFLGKPYMSKELRDAIHLAMAKKAEIG